MSTTTGFSYANYFEQQDFDSMADSLLDDSLALPLGGDFDFLSAPLDPLTDDQLFDMYTTTNADSSSNYIPDPNPDQEPLRVDAVPYTAPYNPYSEDDVEASFQIPSSASNAPPNDIPTGSASSTATPASIVTVDAVASDPFESLSMQTPTYDDFIKTYAPFDEAMGPEVTNDDVFGSFGTPEGSANTLNTPVTAEAGSLHLPPTRSEATPASIYSTPQPAATDAPTNPLADLTDAEWDAILDPYIQSTALPSQEQTKLKSYKSPTVTDEYEESYQTSTSVQVQQKQQRYYASNAAEVDELNSYAAMSAQAYQSQQTYQSSTGIDAYGRPVYASPAPSVQRKAQSYRSPAVATSYNAPYYHATEMPAAPYSTHPKTPKKRKASSTTTPPPAPKKPKAEQYTAAPRPMAQPKQRRARAPVDPRAMAMYGSPADKPWQSTGASPSAFPVASLPIDPALSYASPGSAGTRTPQSAASAAYASPSPANTPASHLSAPPALAYQSSPPTYASPTIGTGYSQAGSSLPFAIEDILNGSVPLSALDDITNGFTPPSNYRRTPTFHTAPSPPQRSTTTPNRTRQVTSLSKITPSSMPPNHVEGMKYCQMDPERWAKLMQSASLHNGHVKLKSGHWARLVKREDGIVNLMLVVDG